MRHCSGHRRDHEERGFIGRHRARRFGHFAAGFMGGAGMGGREFRMGRKLAAGDLQLIILALLAEAPRHGYEIIKSLEERSGGFYAPSPGMVYPSLTYLEEIGHATVETEGNKKLYRITDAGRAHLEKNRPLADAMLAQLARMAQHMERVRRAFANEVEEEANQSMARALHEARHDLRAAIVEKRDAAPEEQKRVAEILARAAKEIRGN